MEGSTILDIIKTEKKVYGINKNTWAEWYYGDENYYVFDITCTVDPITNTISFYDPMLTINKWTACINDIALDAVEENINGDNPDIFLHKEEAEVYLGLYYN